MIYRNQNLAANNNNSSCILILEFCHSIIKGSTLQEVKQYFDHELKDVINSGGEPSNWLLQQAINFYQNNKIPKTSYFLILTFVLIVNIQIKIQRFYHEQQTLTLNEAQKKWLDSVYFFHQNTLDIWFNTITKGAYPWDSDPKYCNEDLQERFEYNINFLEKLWTLILHLDTKLSDNREKLEKKFQLNYDNVIDVFTITFINRLEREFKECLVKYQEYSIPESIEYSEAAILFLNKDKFTKLPPQKKTEITEIINRHQKVKRPEINLIERLASLAIQEQDEECQTIVDAMMRANQAYLNIDLKYRKQKKKNPPNSHYYRSYAWHNGEMILAKNGCYKTSNKISN